MLQLNRRTLILLTVFVAYQSQTAECWNSSSVKSEVRSFMKNADFKLSQTYDNVVAITLQCISNGDPYKREDAFYADARFTFKQADEVTSGTFRSVYTSQHLSTGTWKADDNKGIQLSSVSVLSHWNNIHCDVANVTTNSKSVQRRAVALIFEPVTIQCLEDYTVLTITKATYGSKQQPNCTADIRNIVEKHCNSSMDSKTCTFSASTKQLAKDPCFNKFREISVDYSCTQPNCAMGIDGIDNNCSKVWVEPLSEKLPTIPNKFLPIQVSSSNSTLTNDDRITKLEEDQRLAEFQIKTQNEIIKDNYSIIHQWIILSSDLICSQKNSPQAQEDCIQQIEYFWENAEKSFEPYKKLE